MLTPVQISAAQDLVVEMTYVVLHAADAGVSSGELYARWMDKISLPTHDRVLNKLVESGYITINAHYIQLTQEGRTLLQRMKVARGEH